MKFLVIDQDRVAMQRLGFACQERGAGMLIAENVSEGVRALLREVVSLIVVDAALLRFTPTEHLTLFDRVAPGVPVVVVARPGLPLQSRVSFELAGFRVLTRPVTAEDLLEKLEPLKR